MAHDSSDKGSLPNGWIVKTSTKHPDRVYYFNILTAASTWDCPELDPPKPVLKNEDSTPKHVSILNRESNSSESIGPERMVDPTKGSHILYNLKRDSDKRTLVESDILPTDDPNKTLNPPPTAIVAPVVLGKKRRASSSSSSSPSMQNSTNRILHRKEALQVYKRRSFPSTSRAANISERSVEILPKKSCKKLKPGSNLEVRLHTDRNKPSTSTASESPIDSDSTDSDMALEFGIPPFSPLRAAAASTSDSAAGSSSPQDIEMLDVSANLVNIDEIAATAKQSNERCCYYIVVDTNVFISELRRIDEIKDTPVEGCGPPHIFIPWIVFRELEGLKNSTKVRSKNFRKNLLNRRRKRKGFSLSKNANDAVRYLNSILKAGHPRFHGQSAKESDELDHFTTYCNDDKILECCISLAEKMPCEKVILLTNDINLANKAMVNNVVVHDWASLIKALKPDCGKLKGRKTPKKDKVKEDQSNPATMSQGGQKNLERKLVKERNIYETEIDNLMCKARQLLKEVLDPFLVIELDEAYGDAWHSFKLERNLLRGILDAFLKYWNSVFTFLCTKKDFDHFKLLHEKANRPEGFYGTLEECLIILNTIEAVFSSIMKLRPYLNVPIEKIQDLSRNCAQIFSKYNEVDTSISEVESAIYASEVKSVLETFDFNWTLINEFCGMSLDFYKVPHNFDYGKPDTFPPESEFRRVASELYPSLLQLKQLMKKMIDTVCSTTSVPPNNIFKQLFKALKDLIPSLHVKAEIPKLTHFNPKALERFCRDPEHRQTIKNGLNQLDTFCTKLHEVILAMVAIKKD